MAKRRVAEEALRENERLLRAVIDGTDDPVFLNSRDCKVLVANAATERIMGASVLGRTFLEYFPDRELAEADIENDRRIMAADRAEEAEEIVPTVMGRRTYLSKKTPWHGAKGKVIGLIGIARDITDRKNMETELRKSAGVSVKDNGESIPDEKKSIIFDRFRQANTSLTRSSEGSGIGLALIKALVELLQGRIWFQSTLGEGSEFFFELPVLQIAERHSPIEQGG